MARSLVCLGLSAALFAMAAPGPALAALIGETPTIRGVTILDPKTDGILDPKVDGAALIGEVPTGRHQLIVRTVRKATGGRAAPDQVVTLPDGVTAVDLLFSNVYRPSSILVLGEDLRLLAYDVAFDAQGLPKLVGDTPAILGPFGDSAILGLGTALAEAPGAVDPKVDPVLGVGTTAGRLIVVAGALDPKIDGVVDLGKGAVTGLATVPQVGFFAFVAAHNGRAVGVSAGGGSPAGTVVFDLADPRPDPFLDLSTGVLDPKTDPLTSPARVSFVAANGTPRVAVLHIPANPTIGGSLNVGVVVIGGCPIARVELGSLVMVEADGGAILYDPGFTMAEGGSGATFTIAGASLDLDPDTLNRHGHGRYVRALIEVEDDGALAIDPSTLRLHYGEASVPVSAHVAPRTGDADEDGQADLLARFDRAAVLGLLADAPDGPATLTARWTYRDGSAGSASGQIRINDHGGAPHGWRDMRHPITGERYTHREIKRLKLLRRRVPDNPLVPKALNPAEEAAWRRRAEAQKAIARRMAAGTASDVEIEAYYAYERELVEARLELVGFVLTETQWDAATKDRYRRVQAASERQLTRIAARRAHSLALHKRRRETPPPPPPVARIEPPLLEVTRGAVARFAARPEGDAVLVSLKWTLPTGESAAGSVVDVETKALAPGLHDVLLQATDQAGRTSHLTALLSVQPGPAADVDLAVEAARAVPLPVVQAAQAEVHAVVRNHGQLGVKAVRVDFQVGSEVLHETAAFDLGPGERRTVSTPPLAAEPLQGHDVLVTVRSSQADADPSNDAATVAVVPGPPPPSGEGIGSPGLRYDGPPLPSGQGLGVAPGAMGAIVTQTAPLPIDLGPIDGFADLHLHQTSNLGFDGRLVWGAHDGPDEETAVPQCSGMNHAVCWFPGSLFDLEGIHEWEVGSHAGLSFPQIPCFSGLFTGGEGASTKGWHPNATSQRFKHWPVWKTVTHQQAYADWLEAAHEQGLSLIVMSAVSSRHMCAVEPFFNGLLGANPFDDITPTGIANTALDTEIRTATSCNDMKNVRRQLLAAWEFDADHDWYEIALTPGQAAQIIQEGKLAVLLAIEASELFDNPETVEEMRAQLDYFVDDLGVRSIQPVHELNNSFGGGAFWSGIFDVVQTFDNYVELVLDVLDPDQETTASDWRAAWEGIARDSTGENSMGVTDLGRQLLLDLMDRELLIDLAHLSKPGSDVAYNIAVERNYYPLYVSHTRYSDLLNDDSPYDDHLAKSWQTVQQVKVLGGMVGLRTAARRQRTYTPGGVVNNCPGSVRDFAQGYQYGAIGFGIPQAFGSDMNGFIQQMRPRFFDGSHPRYDERGWACGQSVGRRQRNDFQDEQGDRFLAGTGTDFDLTGFGRIDQIGDLLADLRDNLGVDTVQLEDSADAFVEMWNRAGSSLLRSAGSACIDRSGIAGGPATGGTATSPGCP
jgi:microsomal dipeptidase-like Zn-dependent dipeptidase